MTGFTHRESYKHKYAKELFAQWLQETHRENWSGDGIHLEYPICADQYAFNYHNGDDAYDYYEKLNFKPSYQDCIKRGDIPIKVADIAYVYKGSIDCIFEIYHTHRISNAKIKLIQEKCPNIKIYEVGADKILNQINRPHNLYSFSERLNTKSHNCSFGKSLISTRTFNPTRPALFKLLFAEERDTHIGTLYNEEDIIAGYAHYYTRANEKDSRIIQCDDVRANICASFVYMTCLKGDHNKPRIAAFEALYAARYP